MLWFIVACGFQQHAYWHTGLAATVEKLAEEKVDATGMDSYTQQITKVCLPPLTPCATCTSNPASLGLLVVEMKTWCAVASEHPKWAIHVSGCSKHDLGCKLGHNVSCKRVNGPQTTVTKVMTNNSTRFEGSICI